MIERSNPKKFVIDRYGRRWRLRTPECESPFDQWQMVFPTFEEAIQAMNKWVRGTRAGRKPEQLFELIAFK